MREGLIPLAIEEEPSMTEATDTVSTVTVSFSCEFMLCIGISRSDMKHSGHVSSVKVSTTTVNIQLEGEIVAHGQQCRKL